MRTGTFGILCVLAFAVCALRCSGEEEMGFRTKYVREYQAANTSLISSKVDRAPKLDGTLNDPLWKQAGKTESAYVLFPSRTPTGRQTVAYVCHDDKALYISIDNEETELDQQQIDNKDIGYGDHVGVLFEVGDTRGRGARCKIIGNRSGYSMQGNWRKAELAKDDYKCVYGPNRWIVQMAIPFSSFPGFGQAALRGELWGIKLVRFGKTLDTGASRMRASWPHINAISEDVAANNAKLFFQSDNMLENGGLALKDGAVSGWKPAGKVDAAGIDGTLSQTIKVRPEARFSIEWNAPEKFSGNVSVKVKGKEIATQAIAAGSGRVDFQQPKGETDASVELALKGQGKLPEFRMNFLLDDVPQEFVCLTNNDWVPTRNLKQRAPDSGDGRYTYLKPWQGQFGYCIYRSNGCPDVHQPGVKMPPSTYVGRPTQEPLAFPPKRPDIGEDEVENFPWQSIWEDGYVPELIGMPMSSFDEGGKSGWIPFSKGSLTGKDSWAGWPVDRWAGAAPHDVLIDLPGKYYIRRLDILFITTSFRNMEIYVKPEGKPESDFILIYKDIGPGTGKPFGYGAIPPYVSIKNLDSVASQVRICLKLDRGDTSTGAPFNNKFGRVNCMMDLFGIAEIWLWGEAKGEHTDSDIKYFKQVMPPEKPPLVAQKLSKLPEPMIWPRPKSVKRTESVFTVNAETVVLHTACDRLPAFAHQIKDDIGRRYLTEVKVSAAKDAAAANVIWLGIPGLDAAFDEVCKKEGVQAPDRPQGYALKVTADKILLAGRDIEGVCWAVQALMQWADHDEKNAFFRGIEISDYPLIPLRTVVPSTDHRNTLYPAKSNPLNFYKIMDGMARNRLNTIVNWTPSSHYQSEATTLQMMRYAYDRGVEVRPAAFFNSFPGEMLEANPDIQPETNAGLGGDDGTWETQNICPSSPVTYRVIEEFVQKSAKLQPYSQYIEFGYLGSHSARFNVCRRCVCSGKTDAVLYQEFVNRVTQICARRNLVPVFSNSFMYGGVKPLAEGVARGAAIRNVARDLMIRIDRPMKQSEMAEFGFCELARPWETPKNFVNDGPYHGGAGFYAHAPQHGWKEATLIEGDDCNYGWAWNRAMSSSIMLFAEQTWNGQAPENKPAAKAAYEEFSLAAANACVRFNEQVSLEHEYPSWRTGIKPAFFSVDIRKACTRSHIDEGFSAGLGRSGIREGWIANGPAFDFRRLPLGENTCASVPFTIIDPAQNDWRSVVFVGNTVKEYLIPKSTARAVIAIGKKAASLCVLRCPVGMAVPAGHWHPEQILPGYTFEYADGTRFVCDRELARNTVPLTCGNPPRTFMSNSGNTPGTELMAFLEPTSRLAFATNTLSGAGASLFLNEFVNPYPEKEISNLIVALPNPEQKEFTLTVHDAIFAVTGVEPTEWDVRFWKARPPAVLLPPNAAVAESAKPLLKTCEWNPQQRRFVDAASRAAVASLNEPGGAKLPTWELTFAAPRNVAAIGYRLSMPGAYSNPMPIRLRHTDVTVLVQEGKEWKEIAIVRGSTAMDGEQIVACDRKGVTAIRVVLNSAAYSQDEETTGIGLLALETYVQP